MARFYGSIQGQKGEATRLGSAKSGLRVTAAGWDIGAVVSVHTSSKDEDIITVSIDGGSNGDGSSLFLGSFVRKDGKLVKVGE